MLRKNGFLLIPADPGKSGKSQNPFQQTLFKSFVKRYGKHPYFTLTKTTEGYKLISQLESKEIFPQNEHYSYVIVLDEQTNKPLLKIFKAGHYFLSDKASAVLAAGDIEFENNQVKFFNDRTGTYHLENPSEIEEYQKNINQILASVGLPIEHYVPTKPKAVAQITPEKKSSCPYRCLFFSVAAPIVLIAGVAASAYFDLQKQA